MGNIVPALHLSSFVVVFGIVGAVWFLAWILTMLIDTSKNHSSVLTRQPLNDDKQSNFAGLDDEDFL